jgi:ABC-2 type transport system permease protein
MKITKSIQKAVSDCFIIWKQELRQVRKDVGVIIFFIVVPLVYPVLYGFIYNTEAIHEVPLIVVDESYSSLARDFARKVDASPDVRVIPSSSLGEAQEMVNQRKGYGILLIPSDFSYKINRNEQATIALYGDMSSMLFYQAFLLATTEAGFELNDKIHIQTEKPVLYQSVAYFNPQNGFASFLLPGILILVIQQTLLLGIGLLCGTARENNRGRLIPERDMFTGILRIVSGRCLAYLTFYVFVCFWALIIVPYLFRIPQLADFGMLLLFTLPYLLACIFFAMTIASFIRGRETPMMLLLFTSLIFLFLSGISWPQSAIPVFWKYCSYLIPSTFGIQGFIKLNSMGANLWEVAFEYRMLWIHTAFYFVITCLIYRYEIFKVFKKKSN